MLLVHNHSHSTICLIPITIALSLVKCFLAFLDKVVFKLAQLCSWTHKLVAVKIMKKKSRKVAFDREVRFCSELK